jgi:hypothetical protein
VEWKIQDATATDWAQDGFALQGIWVGIDGTPLEEEAFIETGVLRGHESTNVYSYYTGYGDTRNGAFDTKLISGTPTVGQTKWFKVVNCMAGDPGCNGVNSSKFVACYGETVSTCEEWVLPYTAGTFHYREGYEVTCASNRVNKTYVSGSQFRYLSNWVNIASAGGSSSSIISTYTPVGQGTILFNAPADPDFGAECCTGVTPGSNPRQCLDPGKQRYWYNSSTPTAGCN